MPKSLIDRILAKVNKDANGCWVWTAARKGLGYGSITLRKGHTETVHRMTYMMFRGEIPTGLVVDHLCRNRLCCNPEHLELVTQAENCFRGIGVFAKNKAKTHCVRGHEFVEGSYKLYRNRRVCLACDTVRMRQLTVRRRLSNKKKRIFEIDAKGNYRCIRL